MFPGLFSNYFGGGYFKNYKQVFSLSIMFCFCSKKVKSEQPSYKNYFGRQYSTKFHIRIANLVYPKQLDGLNHSELPRVHRRFPRYANLKVKKETQFLLCLNFENFSFIANVGTTSKSYNFLL